MRGKHRALPYAEVPAFMRSLMTEVGTAAQALQLLTLTAARTAEVIGMTWSEIAGDTYCASCPHEGGGGSRRRVVGAGDGVAGEHPPSTPRSCVVIRVPVANREGATVEHGDA